MQCRDKIGTSTLRQWIESLNKRKEPMTKTNKKQKDMGTQTDKSTDRSESLIAEKLEDKILTADIDEWDKLTKHKWPEDT